MRPVVWASDDFPLTFLLGLLLVLSYHCCVRESLEWLVVWSFVGCHDSRHVDCVERVDVERSDCGATFRLFSVEE